MLSFPEEYSAISHYKKKNSAISFFILEQDELIIMIQSRNF
jgi:hypothetical protein